MTFLKTTSFDKAAEISLFLPVDVLYVPGYREERKQNQELTPLRNTVVHEQSNS